MTTPNRPLGSCERARLLLSLSRDGAATPQHVDEIAAHVPHCDACRRAAAADEAVGARLRERAAAPAPAWLGGFAARTVARAALEAREARSQNRLLAVATAAAVLVALSVNLLTPPAGRDAGQSVASTRDEATRLACFRRLLASHEGK
jgi:hypothetical protein